ncbi:MAG: hypothetical protein NW217_00345 [Hyphomicrobiaceae bacterium]|nr:hypothetical protein [Hyphomicrobiaceae bacterium]
MKNENTLHHSTATLGGRALVIRPNIRGSRAVVLVVATAPRPAPQAGRSPNTSS